MKKVLSALGLGVLIIGCSAGVDATGADPIAHDDAALLGDVNQIDAHPFIPAVVKVNLHDISDKFLGGCSGTVIAPNKVLTAAHCFCGAVDHGYIKLADSAGNLTTPQFPFSFWQNPADALVCGSSWATLSNDDALAHSPKDVAVITLPAPLPGIIPASIFLGDPEIAYNTRLVPKYWAVGFGKNAPAASSPDDKCLGCDVRRSGELNTVRPERDSCGIGEVDCWPGVLWSAPSFKGGANIMTSLGDSGGPLFFNVDTKGAVVSGVSSSWYDGDDSASRWATLGANADFLWDAIGWAPTLTMDQQRAQTAIYVKRMLLINDRAHVEGDGHTGARVVAAAGPVRIGVEAFVGEVRSRGPINLEDRSRSGNVYSSNVVAATPAAIATSKLSAEFQKFEDFNIASPFAGQSGRQFLGPDQNATLPPGIHASLTVNARSNLTLQKGLHIFDDLTLESGSTLTFGPEPTWVFLTTSNNIALRGRVVGTASRLLVAAPNSSWVILGDSWSGTLVAPKANIIADMVTNATLTGSFFSDSFELHQGRYLFHAPFAGNWIPTCTLANGFDGCS